MLTEFSPTFDEWSARYKWNIGERAVKPKSKKKKKKILKKLCLLIFLFSKLSVKYITNYTSEEVW